MTVAIEDRTVRRGLFAEDQLLRNVVGALRRALDDHPDGCLEAALWRGVEACFVPRSVFNEAVDIMVYVGLALRAGGRLHAGLNRTRGPEFLGEGATRAAPRCKTAVRLGVRPDRRFRHLHRI